MNTIQVMVCQNIGTVMKDEQQYMVKIQQLGPEK